MPKGLGKAKTGKQAVTSVVAAPKAIAEKQTRTQIIEFITTKVAGLTKKQVQQVLESLGTMVVCHMKKRGSGEFTIPYTGVRVMRKTRPATAKRRGRNPATGEEIMIAAKPARTVIKIRALKALKDSVK